MSNAICDGQQVVIGAIMEHIEEAGVHSGDSACSLPPYSLAQPILDEILVATRKLALSLGVRGLMNVQYAVKSGGVYVIEGESSCIADSSFCFQGNRQAVSEAGCARDGGPKLWKN